MKSKKSIADIAVDLMKKHGCTQISVSDYNLLNQIAEKAVHTSLPDQKIVTRQGRVLDSLSHDKRFKKGHKILGNRVVRTLKLIET